MVTLATGSAFTGVNLGLTKSVPFYNMPHALQNFGNGRIGAFPFLLIAPLAVSPLLALFLFRLPVGRRLLAVGGNSQAAALSGISPANAIVLAHCLSGLLAAIGAVLAVAQLGSAQPLIGSDWLLLSFAAPIIGGTALAGGYVSITGAILAVLVIALIQNGLVQWVGARQRQPILGAIPAGRPDRGCEAKVAGPFVGRLAIRTPSIDATVSTLSGGNQQKVSITKWLAARTDILIIDEPTVGIDVKTKVEIHELIAGIAGEGVSVLLISSDMAEMITVADRILVMHEFRVVGEVTNDHRYEPTSAAIMTTIHAVEPAAAGAA